jgi:glycosyl transferase family 2
MASLSSAAPVAYLLRRHKKPRPLISLLVPFRADIPARGRNWYWLKEYWKHELPEAELVQGSDLSTPFCKTAAVNDAFRRSHGDVIVILDADCYISGDTIRNLASQIRTARSKRQKLWFIPYRRFYRLSEEASVELLASNPANPMRFSDPPASNDIDPTILPGSQSFGHWYGALIQMMPREAFVAAGLMDERFKGWGGEDLAFMQAVDTMYGPHKTFNGPVFHIHHPTVKGVWAATRQWVGQTKPEMNDQLSGMYNYAEGDRRLMSNLLKGISPYPKS